MNERIVSVRASIVKPGRSDDQSVAWGSHWIDDHIASPMARYSEFRATRRSFGLDVLGTFVVEIEDEAGRIGIGTSTAGVPGCWIVEKHLARFVEGRRPSELELIWDQLYRATLFYGRKGLVLNAISAVDLALWDLLGRQRGLPVYELIGGAVRREQPMYATTARPDLAAQWGFVGAKLALLHGSAEGAEGLARNLSRAADARASVPTDFFLSYDCWMSLDLPYALRLADGLADIGFRWIEEALLPDDYWGCAELRQRVPATLEVAAGEHEATRWGFRMLLEMGCADIIQPDVSWCGGLTELLKIAALADGYSVPVIPHGSSVYSYHFVITRPSSEIAEFLVLSPGADEIVPMLSPLLEGEPVPVGGRITLPETPGFGVELSPAIELDRPYPR